MTSDDGIYFDIPLIVPYFVEEGTNITWHPWSDGNLLGWELRHPIGQRPPIETHLVDGREVSFPDDQRVRIYLDPETRTLYRGVGIVDVDQVLLTLGEEDLHDRPT